MLLPRFIQGFLIGGRCLLAVLFLVGLSPVAGAQESKKKMVFPPGSKTPDGHEEKAPTAKAAEEASRKPATDPKSSGVPSTEGAVGVVGVRTPGMEVDVSVSKLLDTFFTLLSKGNIDPAYEALVQGTVIAGKKTDVDTLKQKTAQAIDLFGTIQGYEPVQVQRVGTRLLLFTCLSLGERFPLRWRFYFYQSGDQWRLIDIRVDDRLTDLFGEREGAGSGDPR